MSFRIILFATLCFFMGCRSGDVNAPPDDNNTNFGNEPTIDDSDPINYETLQGDWSIVEIHANNTETNELQIYTRDESSSVHARLIFYRPTLGDPARLEMRWYCNGLSFSYQYERNVITRISDVGGPLGPWSSDYSEKNEFYYAQPRLSCMGLTPDEEQEWAKIGAVMYLLATRLTLFETYEIDFQLDSNIVSIFTSEGDGIYGMRL